MALEDSFNQSVNEWIEHCSRVAQLSSSDSAKNCHAYRKIVAMGKGVLPLLRRLYDQPEVDSSGKRKEFAIIPTDQIDEEFMKGLFDFQYGRTAEESNGGFERMLKINRHRGLSILQTHGIVLAVNEILGGDFSIPSDIKGQTSAMGEYTKNWLDKNMHRYVVP